MDCVLQTMADEHIGPGEKSELFNRTFAQKNSSAAAVSFRTYQDCIKAALRLCEVNEASVVALSPLSPAVYSNVLKEFGCKIVYVDVDRENGMPDSQAVAESTADVLILYEACASIPVKYNSETTYYERESYGSIKIIEDISASVGSVLGEDAKAGEWGSVIICSLEENDVISAGGGAVLAVKDSFVQQLNELDVSDYQKLTDLNASLGLIQLENLAGNSAKRREICDVYASGMISTKHKKFGLVSIEYKSNGSSFSVFMDCKPDNLIEFAKRHDVPVVRTFENSACSVIEGDLFEMFPNAASYYYRTVSFPVYPFLNAQEIKNISRIVANLP